MLKKILIIIGIIVALFVIVQIINAAKYKMVVNVVEGENIMGVNPTAEKLDFGDLSRNNGMTRYVTLKSNGNTSAYVWILSWGNISQLVKISDKSFVLKGGEEKKVSFEINIPPSAPIKKYSGWTWVFRIPKI